MFKFNSRKFRTNLYDWGQAVNVITTGRWIFYCIIIGVLGGLAALLFNTLLEIIQQIALTDLTGIQVPKPGGEKPIGLFHFPDSWRALLSLNYRWLIVIIPALGGLLSGYLVFKFEPNAKSQGENAVIRAFHHENGYISSRVPIIKLLASTLTIGTGGSAGKEGPIAQIVAGIGSYIGTKLKMSEQERKILLMAGVGAGVGAIFKAPIGAALFSAEVFYRKDFETEGLVASIISSIIGYSVYASVTGWDPIFTFDQVMFTNPYELPLFILLSLVVMVFGVIYTKLFEPIKSLFNRIHIPRVYKPALGGLAIGIGALFFPAILGSSYGYLQLALDGSLSINFMLALAIFKMLATTITIQSGGSGGVFAPSLVIGGLLGGVMGYGFNELYPGMIDMPEAYVLVGMAAFFAGAANVPVSATIMITEMSRSYGLLVPLIFASSIAYLGAQNWSIYKEQLADRLDSSSFRDSFLSDMMKNVKVRDTYKRIQNMPVINQRWTVDAILDAFGQIDTLILPVENDQHTIVGMISLYDVRDLLRQDVPGVIIAADIMVPPRMLHLNDTLGEAIEFFKETGEPELPVLQHGSTNTFMGVLNERSFLLNYDLKKTKQRNKSGI
ncbi:MAG: chloride channel protein [Bacteroidota bacterium]